MDTHVYYLSKPVLTRHLYRTNADSIQFKQTKRRNSRPALSYISSVGFP